MKKKTLLYIPLVLLFAFAMSALGIHYSNIVGRLNLDPKPYSIPFYYFDGAATNLTEKARDAGIKAGDKIKSINGTPIEKNEDFYRHCKSNKFARAAVDDDRKNRRR